MSDILDLPFDQYQRYGLVKALLASVRGEGERFRVLDVGGRTALLREFLPDDQVELVDVDPSDVPGLILGSGANLPFKDDSFDVVAAFDTLEHVPPGLRGAFVDECGRVARRYVMLAGPYDSPRVAEAEQNLLDFLKVRLDWEHRYLAEHRQNGLPDAVQTRSILRSRGARVEVFGHGALDRWLLLMMLELYVEHEGLLHGIAPRIYRFYNEHLFRSDHGGEVYRHAIVGVFGDAPMPNLQAALDPPGSAPKEATQKMIEMGAELLRYDALRDTYQPEIERMHAEVAAATKNARESAESLKTVVDDLAGHRETIEALRKELSLEREGAEVTAKVKDEQIGGLTADLAGHKEMIAELTRLRTAELAELESRSKELTDVYGEITRLNEVIGGARSHIQSALPKTDEDDVRSLAEEVERIIHARNVLLEEREALIAQRDEARGLLVEERARAEALAEDARRGWNRIGRTIGRRALDGGWLEPRGPVRFDI
ncbi:hypothetical protein Poly30_45520 [Planctomycetes bacterium Poly30]|uniref:Methyltransferase type 11 domain-containing protein n=1 Tax=Saltatorellus ferox TaxID=2528018 RepID=A0A518EY27_9BACT|nr:hypothetical protein Poly30_45520 [Planctomycetes bacterium Poly30]